MGESAPTEQPAALLHGAPGCHELASLPIVQRPFGGGPEGVPVSRCRGGRPWPAGRLGYSGVASAPT
eukprot:5237389-Alexandrium_andersonii.AAC.1